MVPIADELLDPAPARVLHRQRAQHDVLEEEAPGRVAVGADAADDRRQVDHDIAARDPRTSARRRRSRVRSYCALRGTSTVQPRVAERGHDVAAEESAAAGDDDALRCQACHGQISTSRGARAAIAGAGTRARSSTWRPITSTSMLVLQKAVERLRRRQHDRLVFVERGVQQHRHAGEAAEGLDQVVVARVRPRRSPSAAVPIRRRA